MWAQNAYDLKPCDLCSWEFAIYKYSDNCYDPSEFMFPGTEFVDGSIVGAMKAGIKAYEF